MFKTILLALVAVVLVSACSSDKNKKRRFAEIQPVVQITHLVA